MLQDKRISRCYGHNLVGKMAVVKKVMQNWGPRVTAIPIICTEGMVDLGLYEGNVNAATFLDFVTEKLCPHILPFNDVNPRSVVILGKEDGLLGNHAFRKRFQFLHCSPPTKIFSPFRDEDFAHHSNGCQLQRHTFKINLPLEKLMLYCVLCCIARCYISVDNLFHRKLFK